MVPTPNQVGTIKVDGRARAEKIGRIKAGTMMAKPRLSRARSTVVSKMDDSLRWLKMARKYALTTKKVFVTISAD